MTDSDFSSYLTKLNVMHVYNKSLNLWQVIMEDLVVYLPPSLITSFNIEDLEDFLSAKLLAALMYGAAEQKLTFH